ncbi:MAG: hypothetical protein V1817_00185, partial [Candidatus Micrarchaeota archaeon]
DLTGADSTTEYFFLRVKSYPKNYENPIVLRRVSLDTAAKTTNIVLSVRNPSITRTLDVVDVVDEVPSPLAATENDVLFQDVIGSYLSDAPLTLAWRFLQLEPEGKRSVTYQLKTLSDDYSVYGAWTTKQVTTSRKMQLADLVTITDFRLPTLAPGSKGPASFSVFYGGLAPMQIMASLALSPEFTANPRTISNVVLAPRTTQQFDFEVTANADAAAGGYSARAVVAAMSEEVSTTMSLMVIPITFTLSQAMLGGVVALFVLLAFVALIYWRRSASEKRFYSKDRVLYANSLRRIVFGDEKTEKP